MSTADVAYKSKKGYIKTQNFCREASNRAYGHGWVDSCCIDKRSSAELTEAIDNPSSRYDDWIKTIEASRWYTRGWTLQELIACRSRVFFIKDWTDIQDHDVPRGILQFSAEITGIPREVLDHQRPLGQTCIAERMSWASKRKTTRYEDGAYSLLGIFDANLPILYGEGLEGAFRRLQDEILRRSSDETVFAWRGHRGRSGLLARTPRDFASSPPLATRNKLLLAPITVTSIGTIVQAFLLRYYADYDCEDQNGSAGKDYAQMLINCDIQDTGGWKSLAIRLARARTKWNEPIERRINGKNLHPYERVDCHLFDALAPVSIEEFKLKGSIKCEDIVIADIDHEELSAAEVLQDTDMAKKYSYGKFCTTSSLGASSQPLAYG